MNSLVTGATEIVATDIGDFALKTAARLGATTMINTAGNPEALASYHAGKGTFDVLFEASGNQAALNAAFPRFAPAASLSSSAWAAT